MKFHFSIDGLNPGDEITKSTCEQVIGFTEESDPKAFQLEILQLSQEVSKRLHKSHGRLLTVRISNSSLYILTDEEASNYNPKRFEAGLKLARRSHRRLMAVNVGSLDAQSKDRHMKNVAVQAFKLSMLRKQQPAPEIATTRTVPVVLKKEVQKERTTK